MGSALGCSLAGLSRERHMGTSEGTDLLADVEVAQLRSQRLLLWSMAGKPKKLKGK